MTDDSMMTIENVSEYLGIPKATLYAWASRGLGPKRYKIGKHTRMRRCDVDSWVERQAVPDVHAAA